MIAESTLASWSKNRLKFVVSQSTKDFAQAMAKLERYMQMEGAVRPEQRRARFVCALSLALPGGEVRTFTGRV